MRLAKHAAPKPVFTLPGPSEFWLLPRCVPEMEYFDHALFFMNAVIDLKRRVEKPPHRRKTLHRRPEVWKVFEKINVVEKRVGKLLASARCFSHDQPMTVLRSASAGCV